MEKFQIEENNINEAIKDVYEGLFHLAEEKNLKLALELDEKTPKIKFDRDKIVQVLTNIIGNAIRFTQKGEVTVATVREEGVIHVSVRDTGPGIKETDVPKLFHPFEQLDKGEKRMAGGTGLGLAISKEIIERHQGKIWAQSKFGEGTTFHFTLPA